MRSADPRPGHRIASLALLLGAELAAVATLHRLGAVDGLAGPGTDPGGWLGSASPEEVVAGALRVVALACAWWLLASTVLYLVARVARVPAAARTMGRATLPAVRRWVDRAVAASVLASTAVTAGGSAAIAGSEPPPPSTTAPAVVVDADRRLPPDETRPVPEVRGGRAVESLPGPPTNAPSAPVPPSVPVGPALPAAPPAPGRHVVATGESLWTIAAAHLAGLSGRDRAALGDHEIAPYWARVVDVNRGALRSGNPDLIYPGEVLELPPPV